jgi:hypothetical protein
MTMNFDDPSELSDDELLALVDQGDPGVLDYLDLRTMNYDQFCAQVAPSLPRDATSGMAMQREGQWFFNCLYVARPHLANELRGSLKDPFYKDYVSQEVHEFCRKNW